MRGAWVCLVVMAACGYPKLPALGGDDDDVKDAPSQLDGPAGFAPSHLDPSMLLTGAPDLVVINVTGIAAINTTTLTVNNANNPFFVRQGPYAVLYANAFSIQGATVVTGTFPLIVVATDRITVTASVQASGTGSTAGPGAQAVGVGVGSPGQTFATTPRESSGGGGGSYGSLGGPGGTSDPAKIVAGASGVRYGTNPTDPLLGGSSGGAGGDSIGTVALGGVGGGAIQLSSAIAIEVTGATINVGGGGGGTGGTGLAGGGGGGSGGELFLEAPMITMSGTLVANGGGGGGGGSDGSTASTAGQDGTVGPGVATGGTGAVPEGSPGGAGAAGLTGSFVEAKVGDGGNSKGGGGGGGAGRIWLRFHASTPPVLTNGRISPPAGIDSTLP